MTGFSETDLAAGHHTILPLRNGTEMIPFLSPFWRICRIRFKCLCIHIVASPKLSPFKKLLIPINADDIQGEGEAEAQWRFWLKVMQVHMEKSQSLLIQLP